MPSAFGQRLRVIGISMARMGVSRGIDKDVLISVVEELLYEELRIARISGDLQTQYRNDCLSACSEEYDRLLSSRPVHYVTKAASGQDIARDLLGSLK